MEEWDLLSAVAKFYRQKVSITDVFTADGTRYMEKTQGLTLLLGTFGAASSLGLGIAGTRSLVASIPRMLYGGGFGALVGGTYVSAVHIMATIRKQDTPINHFAGGLVTGFLFGAKARSQLVGWRSAAVLGILCFVAKDCQKVGMSIVPKWSQHQPPRVQTFNPFSYRNVETYDPEKSPLSRDVSEVVKILEANRR